MKNGQQNASGDEPHETDRETDGSATRSLRYLLLGAAGMAGLLAVVAGLLGLETVTGGSAAVLFVILFLLPWIR